MSNYYVTKDGATITLTNIMLTCPKTGNFTEIHMGGTFNPKYITHLDEFKAFAAMNKGKEIKVEAYSYEVYGSDGHKRKATRAEADEIIDDDFPNNYDNMKCIDHGGAIQFTIRNGERERKTEGYRDYER